METPNKKCSKCGVVKPLEDYTKRNTATDGRRGACKDCERPIHLACKVKRKKKIAAYQKAYYAKIKDRQIDYYRKRRAEDPERFRKYQRARRAKDPAKYAKEKRDAYHLNPAAYIAAVKKSAKKHADRVSQYRRLWREKNRESINAKQREYIHTHRPMFNEKNARNRTIVREQTPAWADKSKIRTIYALAQKLTRETGIEHHVDHIIPLKGKTVCGLHVENNLRVIPATENLKKNNRLVECYQ